MTCALTTAGRVTGSVLKGSADEASRDRPYRATFLLSFLVERSYRRFYSMHFVLGESSSLVELFIRRIGYFDCFYWLFQL